jgi:hypothetical protein
MQGTAGRLTEALLSQGGVMRPEVWHHISSEPAICHRPRRDAAIGRRHLWGAESGAEMAHEDEFRPSASEAGRGLAQTSTGQRLWATVICPGALSGASRVSPHYPVLQQFATGRVERVVLRSATFGSEDGSRILQNPNGL